MDTFAVDSWGRVFTVGLVGVTGGGPIVPPMPPVSRAPQWPRVLHDFLKAHPLCEGCGRRAETAHHETPVGVDPARELDPTNLIAVCVPCHFVGAHLGRWNTYDPDARKSLAAHRRRVKAAKLI